MQRAAKFFQLGKIWDFTSSTPLNDSICCPSVHQQSSINFLSTRNHIAQIAFSSVALSWECKQFLHLFHSTVGEISQHYVKRTARWKILHLRRIMSLAVTWAWTIFHFFFLLHIKRQITFAICHTAFRLHRAHIHSCSVSLNYRNVRMVFYNQI